MDSKGNKKVLNLQDSEHKRPTDHHQLFCDDAEAEREDAEAGAKEHVGVGENRNDQKASPSVESSNHRSAATTFFNTIELRLALLDAVDVATYRTLQTLPEFRDAPYNTWQNVRYGSWTAADYVYFVQQEDRQVTRRTLNADRFFENLYGGRYVGSTLGGHSSEVYFKDGAAHATIINYGKKLTGADISTAAKGTGRIGKKGDYIHDPMVFDSIQFRCTEQSYNSVAPDG